jgi:transposase
VTDLPTGPKEPKSTVLTVEQEAVIWKFRSGAPWRDLPERFGAWKNIHTRLSRWAKSGVREDLFKALADDPDNE